MLIEREGEVVTREEIRKQRWPNNTLVNFDHSINAATKKPCLALGDSSEEPKYVETVSRRGYRLIVVVDWGRVSPADGPSAVPGVRRVREVGSAGLGCTQAVSENPCIRRPAAIALSKSSNSASQIDF